MIHTPKYLFQNKNNHGDAPAISIKDSNGNWQTDSWEDYLNSVTSVAKSLLAAGITKIKGSFDKGENVFIIDENDKLLARGLVSFNSKEIDKIKGKQSNEIEKILGYLSKTEIIHKDDMVLL